MISGTERAIYGNTTPQGTYGVYSDGAAIKLGHTFYQTDGSLTGSYITGGRVWTPADGNLAIQIRIMLFADPGGVKSIQYNLDTTPIRSVVVNTTPGGWTEARWSGFAIPPTGQRWMIAYEFVDNSQYYIAGAGAFNNDASLPALDGTALALSPFWEPSVASGGQVARGYYKYWNGAVNSISSNSVSYAVDTIIDNASNGNAPTVEPGSNQVVAPNTLVTLDGSGSSAVEGTLTDYNWVQTGGETVTLSGSGATRTFTPTTLGSRTFQLAVTDENGNAASATVAIYVNSAHQHTVFGADPPPGTIGYAVDGASLKLGATFYQTSPGLNPSAKIVGGRVYTPKTDNAPAQVRIMLYSNADGVRDGQFNLETTPLQSIVVDTVPGSWTEARWTGVTPPAVGYRWMIAYEFVSPQDSIFVSNSGVRGSNDPIYSPDSSQFCFAEDDATATYGAVHGSYYRYTSGASGSPTFTSAYGVDTIVEINTSSQLFDAVYVGATAADAVYVGETKIWP